MATYGHEGGHAFNEDQRGGHEDSDYRIDEIFGPLVVGGIEGRNLDHLARVLVSETPKDRRQSHLRYMLERALNILDSEVAGKGIE